MVDWSFCHYIISLSVSGNILSSEVYFIWCFVGSVRPQFFLWCCWSGTFIIWMLWVMLNWSFLVLWLGEHSSVRASFLSVPLIFLGHWFFTQNLRYIRPKENLENTTLCHSSESKVSNWSTFFSPVFKNPIFVLYTMSRVFSCT